jgi:hypothetical protein
MIRRCHGLNAVELGFHLSEAVPEKGRIGFHVPEENEAGTE